MEFFNKSEKQSNLPNNKHEEVIILNKSIIDFAKEVTDTLYDMLNY